MIFPDDIFDFLEEWTFHDTHGIYSDGIALVPLYRVTQALEHYYGEKENRSERIKQRQARTEKGKSD